MTQDLHYKTLSEIASRIAEGDLDSVFVTQLLLARIEALEPKLHAYTTVTGEQALEQAALADQGRQRGARLGALHGVPIAVKDLCHKRGTPTTGGHSFRRGFVSDFDATVVARLEAAGAVILGKLATTEGANIGYHADFEVPRNPWGELDRWPGVSSGGSGVATAAGLCFGAIGTDTGGSIRYPSAVNGVVGLKPTWGRVSRHGVLDLAPTLDHVGPITRSVGDAARMLAVIAGHDENDPTSLADPVPDYETEMQRGVAGLRIGWDESFATADVKPYVAHAVRRAVSTLADLGAEIVEIQVPHLDAEAADAWETLASVEAAAVHDAKFPSQAAQYGEYFRGWLERGRQVSAMAFAKANFARKRATGAIAPIFSGIDLLVCPTLAAESFRYDPEDAYRGIDIEQRTVCGVPFDWLGHDVRLRFTSLWDYNGYPTLSIPCGFSPDNMPLSLQLIAPPLREAVLCRAGFAYEQAHDFHAKHPQI